MQEECLVCTRLLPDTEGCAVMVARATPQSWSSPGDPPEYEWICYDCQETEEMSQYDYDPCEEDLWHLNPNLDY